MLQRLLDSRRLANLSRPGDNLNPKPFLIQTARRHQPRGGQSIDGLGDLRIGNETTLSNHDLESGLRRRTHTEIHRSAVYRKAGAGEDFRIGVDRPVLDVEERRVGPNVVDFGNAVSHERKCRKRGEYDSFSAFSTLDGTASSLMSSTAATWESTPRTLI